MSGFQNQVNVTPAPAVAGDFASSNPRASVLAGPGGLIAGAFGVAVGLFAWIQADNQTVENFGTSPAAPDGFVHRDQQALITTYLASASNVIPAGFPVTLMRTGDFWALNNGPNALTKGATVYAGYADGKIYSAAPAGASVTATTGSTNTASIGSTFTATGTGTSLVVTAVTGLISIGDTISGTGVTAGTTIVAQVSGTTGGAGTYTTSIATTASAATVTSFGTVLSVSAASTFISIGDTVSGGAGFPAVATVTGQISGTANGVGVYSLSAPATAYVASATGVLTFGLTIKVTAIGSGVISVGDPISDSTNPTALPANASVASQVNGTPGGIGVYNLNPTYPATAYHAGDTLVTVGGIATTWKAYPTNSGDGAVGSLVKISSETN